MGDHSVPTTSCPSGLVLKFQMPGWEDLIDFVSPALLVELVSFDWHLSPFHMEWERGIRQKQKMPSALALPSPLPSSPVFQIGAGEGSAFRMFGVWSGHSGCLIMPVS